MIVDLYHGDCIEILDKLKEKNLKVNGVLTSPPYNVSRVTGDMYSTKYNEYKDTMSNDEYIDFQTTLMEKLERILVKNGSILYNINYGAENTDTLWLLLANIIQKTELTIVEQIIWKKGHAIPNNVSKNRLTRIVENVFVLCRKSEINSFNTNKPVISYMKGTGQKVYANKFNFIEAPNNNQGKHTKIHKATYSVELCANLIELYYKEKEVILDPFMGTGTTGIACMELNRKFVGIEIDSKYFDISKKRVYETKNRPYQMKFDFYLKDLKDKSVVGKTKKVNKKYIQMNLVDIKK